MLLIVLHFEGNHRLKYALHTTTLNAPSWNQSNESNTQQKLSL